MTTHLERSLWCLRISAHSRRRFHDFCAEWGTVRRIAQVFEAEGVMPVEDYEGPESGQRRWEAASHEASLDLASDADNRRLLRVYAEAIAEFGTEPDGGLVPAARALVASLQRDGAEAGPDGELVVPLPPAAAIDFGDHSRLSRPDVLQAHLDRISASVESEPAAAIAAAKELVESACKFVLEDYGVEFGRKDDALDLYKKAAAALKLNAESVPDSAKGSQSAQRALRSMVTSVQALAELRNELGLGHGRTKHSPALARHARLAASLATGAVQFLLDTWHVRRETERT